MSIFREPLVFKWIINKEIIEETFYDTAYNPSEEGLKECDYIFQYHSVINSYRYGTLDYVSKEFNSLANDYFFRIIDLDDSFLDAVSCLKIIFASFLKYELFCNDLLEWYDSSGSGTAKQRIISRSQEFLEELPNTNFCFFMTTSLPKAIENFERKNNSSQIKDWLKESRREIQRKADDIAQNMEKIFSQNLWKDFEEFIKKDCGALDLMSLKSKIIKFDTESNEVIKSLKTLIEGYTKYVKNDGCYAICVSNSGKYYSLSGVSDYGGRWQHHRKLFSDDPLNLSRLVELLSPEDDFIYAPLTDDVVCYGLWNWRDYHYKYFSEEKKLDKAIQECTDFCARDVSCCERKILAKFPDEKEYKFFIRFTPCHLCQPAMLSTSDKKIVSYVPSEDKKKLRKLIVQSKDSLYENIEIT